MKNILFVSLISMTILITGAFAYAGDGALIIKDVGCSLAGGASGLPCNLTTFDAKEVDTPSGNVSLVCIFHIPDGCVPVKSVKSSGFECYTSKGVTTDSFSVASPDETAMLRCQIKKQNNSQ